MAERGVIRSRFTLDTTDYFKNLQAALVETKRFDAQVRQLFKAPLSLPKVEFPGAEAGAGAGRSRVDPAIAQQREQVRQYRDAQNALRTELERGVKTNGEYIISARKLQREMLEYQTTLPRLSREWAALDRAIATSERGIITASGRLSKLGLSQQVNIALTNQLQSQFMQLGGVAGGAASLGIDAMGGSLAGVSTGAALAGGAILGTGVAAAALVQRGVPQVKTFQNSINILAASGAKDLDKLDQTLGELQNSAGRAARQFSRAELAAALAETVKAGVEADDALTILRSSLQLAAAEGTSLTDSTALVLKAIRQYQLGVDDAATVTDRLAQAGLLAAGTATDISAGLSRVAGTGRAAGVEMSDLIGMLIELDNAGVEASDRGASALNSALTALAGLTPKAKEQLESWNIAVTNSDGSARLAGDILVDLGDKLRTAGVQYDENTDQLVGNGEALRGLANVMGTEGGRAVLNLTGKWRDYSREVQNSQGVSKDYSNQMTQGLEPAQKRLKAAMDDLGKSAATIFAPGMEKAADALAAVARQMDSVTNRPLSFGNIIDAIIGADGEQRLKTVFDDMARVEREIAEVRGALNDPKNTTVRNGILGVLGIGGSTQGQIDKFIRDNEALLVSLENQLRALQQRRDKILEKYGLGSPGSGGGGGSGGGRAGSRQKPVEEVPLPIPDVSAYYDEVAAAEAEAAERLAQQRLETARTLRESIVQMQEELNAELANASNDPLRVINQQFQQTSRQIEREISTLLREAEQAYKDGALNYEQYEAEIARLGALGVARHRQNEKDKTAATQAELRRRQEIIARAEGQLEQARVDAIQGDIPKREAQFKLDQEERLKGYQQELKDLKGTAEERARLIRAQNATEAILSRTHQQEMNRLAKQGLEAYNKAVVEANRLLLEAEREAQDKRLALERDYQQARVNLAKFRLDARAAGNRDASSVDSIKAETNAFNAYIQSLQNATKLTAEQVQVAKERIATDGVTEQNLAALKQAEEAHLATVQQVTGAIEEQIESYRALQAQQAEVINSRQAVFDFFKETQKYAGDYANSQNADGAYRNESLALGNQLDGLIAIFDQQRANNAGAEELLQTLRSIDEVRAQIAERPFDKLIGDQDITAAQAERIAQAGRELANQEPAKLREAGEAYAFLGDQIDKLEEVLDKSQSREHKILTDLSQLNKLDLQIEVDDTEAKAAIEAANKALQETFGPAKSQEIIDETTRTGSRAGRGLIEAFAQGVLENRKVLGNAIRSVMQSEVRDYLTGSNAKKPPLNNVTGSGAGLVSAYAAGMRKQFPELRSASLAFANIARPMVQAPVTAIPTSRPASYPSMAGGSAGDTFGDTHIHVDAQGLGERAPGIIDMEARRFAQTAIREAKLRVRMRGGSL